MNRIETILLVDDDGDDRSIFSEALWEVDRNVKLITAINGEEALTLLENPDTETPDLIFLDLNMPMLNGRQCLKEMKKMEKLKDTPIIIYSTSKLEIDKIETRLLGACHFITKPTLFAELCKTLEFVLSVNWKKIENSVFNFNN